MKARSPNLGDYGINKHYGTGPYHKVAGFLVENEDCKMETNAFSQKKCPDENRNGFYFDTNSRIFDLSVISQFESYSHFGLSKSKVCILYKFSTLSKSRKKPGSIVWS